MKTLRVDDLPWEEARSPSGKFHSFSRNVSLALGGRRDLGPWAGGHPFDLQMRRVPPGASVCPFHAHQAQWELFVALAGEATVRTEGERTAVRAGDAFLQAPGTAHQIVNTGAADFVFYVIADNPQWDSTYYPDSRKWMVKPARKVFREDSAVEYFDGEDG
ncbi:MAG: cupin domain-containing protein [Opitutaceae bacterium]